METIRSADRRAYYLFVSALLALGSTVRAQAPAPLPDDTVLLVSTPEHAPLVGLESLKRAIKQDGGVPLPADLAKYVRNKQAAMPSAART